MSYKVRCLNHKVIIRIPESDNEFKKLNFDFKQLLEHTTAHPECQFVKNSGEHE